MAFGDACHTRDVAQQLFARRPVFLVLLVALVLVLALAGCSSSDDPRDALDTDTAQASVSTSAPTTTIPPAPETTRSTVPAEPEATVPPATDALVPTSLVEVTADDELVRRPEENAGTDEGNHWIGRNVMTDSSVEVVWSEVDGTSVIYRVYRAPITADLDRENIALTNDLLVYEGPSGVTTFVDGTVETGTFYSYLLAVDVDGTTLPRRWANALAVTDTEPPSPITNLESEIVDGEVVLRWDPSTDNVEFASYSVSLVVDGELRYLGGGGDQAQASFVDTRPEPGTNTYSVQAVDFHNNRTEEARIEVTVG